MKSKEEQDLVMVLANGEGMFFTEHTKRHLSIKHIFAKYIGVNSSSKNITEFVSAPLIVDSYSCAYIYENKVWPMRFSAQNESKLKGIIQSMEYKVYKHFTESGNYVIAGHKFGAHFLVYDSDPEQNHAKYLAFIEDIEGEGEISDGQVSRLAGICKKGGIICRVLGNQVECRPVEVHKLSKRQKFKQLSPCKD